MALGQIPEALARTSGSSGSSQPALRRNRCFILERGREGFPSSAEGCDTD